MTGAPGIGGPAIARAIPTSYTQSTRTHGATLEGGIYPNGLDTKWCDRVRHHDLLRAADPGRPTSARTSPVRSDRISCPPGREHHLPLPAGRREHSGRPLATTTASRRRRARRPTRRPTSPPPRPPSRTSATQFDAAVRSIPVPRSPTTPGISATAAIKDAGPSRHHHAYLRLAGTYNVTLIVTNSSRQKDSVSQLITIDDPTRVVHGSDDGARPDTPASFDGHGSTDSLGRSPYGSNFGDGATADTEPHDDHPQLAERGMYTSTLTITTNFGRRRPRPVRHGRHRTDGRIHSLQQGPNSWFARSASTPGRSAAAYWRFDRRLQLGPQRRAAEQRNAGASPSAVARLFSNTGQ